MATTVRWTARMCWALDRRPWLLTITDCTAAALFVVGCLAFFDPAAYVAGVGLFLLGSVLMLGSALGQALLRFGPSE